MNLVISEKLSKNKILIEPLSGNSRAPSLQPITSGALRKSTSRWRSPRSKGYWFSISEMCPQAGRHRTIDCHRRFQLDDSSLVRYDEILQKKLQSSANAFVQFDLSPLRDRLSLRGILLDVVNLTSADPDPKFVQHLLEYYGGLHWIEPLSRMRTV
jgi:hypothetical protein